MVSLLITHNNYKLFFFFVSDFPLVLMSAVTSTLNLHEKGFLCAHRWWKQEGGLLEWSKQSDSDMLWTGQPLALSVSMWSPCVQQCGRSCSGPPRCCRPVRVTETDWQLCSTERLQLSIFLNILFISFLLLLFFFESIHPFKFLSYGNITVL